MAATHTFNLDLRAADHAAGLLYAFAPLFERLQAMTSLKWPQVHAWRLSQHCLSPRLQRRDLVEAARSTGGLQAQVMSAAELALWARVDSLARADIQTALWRDRTLVKTWAMRGALHLIAADDLPLYAAARTVDGWRNWAGYFAYYGLSPAQQEAFLAAVPRVLSSKPMTREELAASVADYARIPRLRKLILSSGWGSPLKPSAFRGELCFGPSRGQNVTFVNPRKWTGARRSVEPHEALREIARRYLRAYGPATRDDFARWWGCKRTAARKIFESLDDELEPVDVEGWRALALRATVEPMREAERPGSAHLVPLFDAYTFGFGRHLEPLLAESRELEVFRPQGWISAAVIVDGCIAGVWEHKAGGGRTIAKVRLFSALNAAFRKRIEAEAQRLGAFLESDVTLEYAR